MILCEPQLVFLNLANQKAGKGDFGGTFDAAAFYRTLGERDRGEVRTVLVEIAGRGGEISRTVVLDLCIAIRDQSVLPVLCLLAEGSDEAAREAAWEMANRTSTWPLRGEEKAWHGFPLEARVWRNPLDFEALLAGEWEQRAADFS